MILEWIIINRGLSVNLYFVYIFILKDYSYSSYQPIDTRLPDSYEFVCPTSWKGKTIDLKNLQFLTPLVYSPGNQEKLGRCFTTHIKIKLFKLQTQFKPNLKSFSTGFFDLFLAICLRRRSLRMSRWLVMLSVPPGAFLPKAQYFARNVKKIGIFWKYWRKIGDQSRK